MVATCATMQSNISWNSKLHRKHPTKCKGASPIISSVKVQVKTIGASRNQWTQPSCQPSPKRVWSPKIFFRDDLFHSTNDQPRISAEDQLLQEFQGGAHDLWITWHFERQIFRNGERWSDFSKHVNGDFDSAEGYFPTDWRGSKRNSSTQLQNQLQNLT